MKPAAFRSRIRTIERWWWFWIVRLFRCSNDNRLASVLLYHFLPTVASAAQLTNGQRIPTALNGRNVTVSKITTATTVSLIRPPYSLLKNLNQSLSTGKNPCRRTHVCAPRPIECIHVYIYIYIVSIIPSYEYSSEVPSTSFEDSFTGKARIH